jgi:AcrR family transcriptional regulator
MFGAEPYGQGVTREKPAAGKRAKTRRRLVEAAVEVVAEKGFHGASVDDIAARAGLSIGALYSNFGGKDELLFAIFDEHVQWFERTLEATAEAGDPARAVAEWIGSLARDPEQFLIFVEFWAYAVRRSEVRDRLAARLAEMREAVAATVARRGDRSEEESSPAPEVVAQLVLALGRGLALEKLADPEAVSDEAFGDVMASLARL